MGIQINIQLELNHNLLVGDAVGKGGLVDSTAVRIQALIPKR